MGGILVKGHIVQTIGMSEITRFVTTSLLNSFARRGVPEPNPSCVPAGWSGLPCQVTLLQPPRSRFPPPGQDGTFT